MLICLTVQPKRNKIMHETLTLPCPPSDSPDYQELVTRCAMLLKKGHILAVPTETVYGLAGDATNPKAIKAIYKAKGRPSHNPLIVHVDSEAMAETLAVLNPLARRLMTNFWPGPLTLVCPLREGHALAPDLLAGHDSVALRSPQGFVRDLVRALGRPVAAPSANRSGHVSATSAAHVLDDLAGRIGLIVDGGECVYGLESTIVDMRSDTPVILRQGAIVQEQLETALKRDVQVFNTSKDGQATLSPGLLLSHYAPKAKLRLNATHVKADEALLAFGLPLIEGAENCKAVVQLSEEGDLGKAASKLFEALRKLDATRVETIAVMPVPAEGLGAALQDRLQRAAAPRPAK
jgi:L-threonylcarbamoyladenylate synthase